MDLRSHQRNVNYLGRNYNIWATHFIEDRRVCIKTLRSRLKAIQKLRPPLTVKGVEVLQGW